MATSTSGGAAQLWTDLPTQFGPYHILKRLGRGGMGTVFLARDSRLNREVALKICHGVNSRPDWFQRFQREAQAAAALRHPNLCPVYECDVRDGIPYLTMAYIEGPTLTEWAGKRGPLPQVEAAALVRKLALAMQQAHAKGVIHRDLKPANIVLEESGEPVILDFGLARHDTADAARLTRLGESMGTPVYMAPEQAAGDVEKMGPACDIYSLGVILYELLTGRPPFEGPPTMVLAQVLTVAPPPPSSLRRGIDPRLEAICLKALAKTPADRHASMSDFAAALEQAVRGLPRKPPTKAPDWVPTPAVSPEPALVPITEITKVVPPTPTLPSARPTARRSPRRRADEETDVRPNGNRVIYLSLGALVGLGILGIGILIVKLSQPRAEKSEEDTRSAKNLSTANPDQPRPLPTPPPVEKTPDPIKKPDPVKTPDPDPIKKPDPPARLGKRPPPKTDRVLVGTYQLPDRLPNVLVHRSWKGDAPFKRLMPGAAVYSNETLVNLPGFTTDIETKTGVALTLRGNLPEFSIDPFMDFLLDVAVVLHAAPDGIDLDLTLERGRIYLANPKDRKDVGVRDVIVRLRFLDQVWDVTLKEGAEVGVDLIKKYTPESDYLKEEPRAEVALCALQGKVQVLINGFHERKLEAPPGLALLQWDSSTDEAPNAQPVKELPLLWSRDSPSIVLNKHIKVLIDAFTKAKPEEAALLKPYLEYYQHQRDVAKTSLDALGKLSDLLNDKKPLELVLEEQRMGMKSEQGQIALLTLSALGQLDKLLAALGDDDPEHSVERDNAVFALRRYLSHGLEASRLLFKDDGKKKTGLLVERYGERDGEKIFTLLHDFNPRQVTAETCDLLARLLKSDKMAVRQLAFWHLTQFSVRLNAAVPKTAVAYNAAAPRELRDMAAAEWQKLVEEGKLPPRP